MKKHDTTKMIAINTIIGFADFLKELIMTKNCPFHKYGRRLILLKPKSADKTIYLQQCQKGRPK